MKYNNSMKIKKILANKFKFSLKIKNYPIIN